LPSKMQVRLARSRLAVLQRRFLLRSRSRKNTQPVVLQEEEDLSKKDLRRLVIHMW
jgi:hypothetical protein